MQKCEICGAPHNNKYENKCDVCLEKKYKWLEYHGRDDIDGVDEEGEYIFALVENGNPGEDGYSVEPEKLYIDYDDESIYEDEIRQAARDSGSPVSFKNKLSPYLRDIIRRNFKGESDYEKFDKAFQHYN